MSWARLRASSNASRRRVAAAAPYVAAVAAVALGGLIALVLLAGLIAARRPWQHVRVTLSTGEMVACPYGIRVTPAYGDVAVLCRYATKDGGFLYHGWALADVTEIEAHP